MSLIEPADAKRALRALMRDRMTPTDADLAALAARLCDLALPADLVLAGVWPLPGEPDLVPAWEILHARGHPIVLPETTARGERLLFRDWQPGAALRAGRFGTRHPDAPARSPDIVFVPLLAWDRELHRLGHGGGYYDRTLAALPDAVAVGFGFSSQHVVRMPAGPYDVALDALVTERCLVTAAGRDFADIVSGRHRRAQRA